VLQIMSGSYQTKEKAAESALLIGQNLQARRQSLLAIQWFFYSAVACLWPFLYSTYASDLGLNAVERTFAQLVSTASRVLLLGPCVYWRFHVHSLRKAKHVLVLSLLLCVAFHLSLLAVPRTIRTARQPRVSLNCSGGSGLVRVEQCNTAMPICPPMGRQSLSLAAGSNHQAIPGVSFSTFSLGMCRRVCAAQLGWSIARVAHSHVQSSLHSFGASLAGEPSAVRLCFHRPNGPTFRGTSSPTRCYLFDPNLSDLSDESTFVNKFDAYLDQLQYASPSSDAANSSVTLRRTSRLQFHSKTDAWIAVSRRPHSPSLLHPYASCVYTQSQPVFVDGDSFERISCFDATTDALSPSLLPSPPESMPDQGHRDNGFTAALHSSDESSPTNSASTVLPADHCESLCNVNLLQRTQHSAQSLSGSANAHSVSVHPTLCEQVQGDPLLTFALFSTFRVLADCGLLLVHLALMSLHTYHTSNLQLLHGGLARFVSFGSAAILWPTISGLLLHLYSEPPRYDYAPCFLLFAAHALVAAALSGVLPVGPAWLELQAALNSRHASNLYLAEQVVYATSRVRKSKVGSSCHLPSLAGTKARDCDTSTGSAQKRLKSGSLMRRFLQSDFGLFVAAVVQSTLVSLYQTQLPVYLLSIGHSRLWIALAESLCWSVYSAFALAAGTCLTTLGRKVWLLLGFTFHALLLSALSATYEPSKWQLMAFAVMRSFAFPLCSMALSALLHCHTPRSRMQHIQVELWLQFIQFAVGPLLASIVALSAQLPHFQVVLQQITPDWLRLRSVDLLASQTPTLMLLDQVNAFRLLVRLLSVTLTVLAVSFVLFDLLWNSCARVCTYDPPQAESDDVANDSIHRRPNQLNAEQRQTLLSNGNHNPLNGIKMIDDGDETPN
jgi:MFS family permease